MTDRNQPSWRLIVSQAVFLANRSAKFLDSTINVSLGNQNFAFNHWSDDAKKDFATVVAQEIVLWHKLGPLNEKALSLTRIHPVSFGSVSDRASGMMKCAREPHLISVLLRLREYFFPQTEAHHYFKRHGNVSFGL